MGDLSNEAIAVRIGVFLSANTSLTMGNVSSVLSPQAARGIAELVKAGIVHHKRDGIADTYRLTKEGQAMDLRKLCAPMHPFDWVKAHGNFSINEPKDHPHD